MRNTAKGYLRNPWYKELSNINARNAPINSHKTPSYNQKQNNEDSGEWSRIRREAGIALI